MIKVLKASAGAGKTYNLVLEYIKALMKAEEGFLRTGHGWVVNPHRHILAITFTNNSTNEMKERILKDLHKLGNGEHEGYEKEIMENLNTIGNPERIREAARRLLEDILNDYSMMRVSTIDSFFNQIIRSFSRDLGLDQTPVAEIDDAHIREKAVDAMLSELDEGKNKELLRFIKEFSHNQISEGKKWKVRESLIEFSKIILSEDYITNFDGDKTTLEEIAAYKEKLKKFVKEQKAEADKALEQMVEIATANQDGMDANTFKAIANRKMESKLWSKEVGEAKFFKKGKGSVDVDNALRELFGIVKETIFSREYQTKSLILKSIYITGVLRELRRVTDQICRDNDCILLSTANHLITKIIDGCEAPFIYERVGVSTNHYMIDEFQDTSHIQWENFMPLIDEADSQGNDSLIVGDIKQSIYRWRNGDWKILHGGIKGKFGESVKEENLPCNFRSAPAIVEFNNDIYTKLPEYMDEEMGTSCFKEIYSNARQAVGEKNRDLAGHVETHFIGKEVKGKEFMEQAMMMIVREILRQSSIDGTAIIVRKNKEAEMAAEALAKARVPFCSSESFLLASDPTVRLVIAYLRHIIAPEEELHLHEMRCVLENPEVLDNLDEVGMKPLEEIPMALVEEIGAEATPFVNSLVDTIKRYVMNNGGSIVSFIEWWDEHKDKLYIPMPNLKGVVTIMTIHKSKGLEFKNVYLLMAKEPWKCGINSKHANYRTVATDDVPHIIVDINSPKLKETKYARQYEEENLDCCIDTLNTLYVATTRAVEKLFIVAHVGSSGVNLNDLLMRAVGRDLDKLEEIEELENPGNIDKPEKPENIEKGAKRKNNRMGFAKISRESAEQRHGSVCHQFLSLIEKEGDEVAALEKMIADGVICEGEKEELTRVYSVLAEKGVFDPAYRSMNEKSIAIDGNIYRPDRIIFKGKKSVWVVDYKFGEKRTEHQKQIERYATLLRGMGYNVESQIFYL